MLRIQDVDLMVTKTEYNPHFVRFKLSDSPTTTYTVGVASFQHMRSLCGPTDKIQLIKMFREVSNLGLRDSKDIVEYMMGRFSYTFRPVM